MSQIQQALDAIIALNGHTVPRASTAWSLLMLETGKDLAQACGVQGHRAATLRAHELRALFSAASQSDSNAIELARKQGWLAQTTAPVAAGAGMSAADITALLNKAREIAKGEAIDQAQDVLDGIPALVAIELAKLAPRAVEVTLPDGSKHSIDRAHKIFETVLAYSSQRIWPYLVGPAGSGKTTIAEQVAKALGLPFYMAAKVQSEFALLGYMNATGAYVATPFRLAYQGGGIFLFDEMDASSAAALTAFNAALANGHCPFPDGLIARHPDFIAIGAGNTMGTGQNRQYVGRTQIDAATLDRFAFLEVEYDLELERALTPNAAWCSYVQALRAEVEARNIRHIVSPRASIAGSKMLAIGQPWQDVAQALVFKGLDAETVQRLKSAVPATSYESQ